MDKCCLCGKPTDEDGAVMLCKEHWDEYQFLAKDNFKEFQAFKRKLEELFKNMTIVD